MWYHASRYCTESFPRCLLRLLLVGQAGLARCAIVPADRPGLRGSANLVMNLTCDFASTGFRPRAGTQEFMAMACFLLLNPNARA
jgi:hypothetical protein